MRIRVKKRRNPVPDPTLSAWAHFGLHYTSTGSDIYSDMAMLQSAIPINNTMLHGVSLVGRARMLKSAVGTMSLPKLADHVRYGWEHGITCLIMQGASRGEIRLTSSDPSANPDLLYHFLDSAADRSRMREAMRLAAGIVGQRRLSRARCGAYCPDRRRAAFRRSARPLPVRSRRGVRAHGEHVPHGAVPGERRCRPVLPRVRHRRPPGRRHARSCPRWCAVVPRPRR